METPISQQCSSCDAPAARCWCVDCNEALCDVCVSAHRRVTVTRSHRILNQPQEEGVSTCPTKFCRLHPSEPLKLFCFTCNTLTCRDCQLTAHMNHRYQFVSEALDSLKKELEDCVRPIREQRDTAWKSLQDMETRLRDIADSESNLSSELQRSYLFLTQQIKTRMEDILKNVKTVCETESQLIQMKMVKLKQLLKDQQSVAKFTEKARNSTDVSALTAYNVQIKSHVKAFHNQSLTTPQRMSQLWVSTDKVSLEAILNFGRLNVNWVPFSVSNTSNQNAPSSSSLASTSPSSSSPSLASPSSSSPCLAPLGGPSPQTRTLVSPPAKCSSTTSASWPSQAFRFTSSSPSLVPPPPANLAASQKTISNQFVTPPPPTCGRTGNTDSSPVPPNCPATSWKSSSNQQTLPPTSSNHSKALVTASASQTVRHLKKRRQTVSDSETPQRSRFCLPQTAVLELVHQSLVAQRSATAGVLLSNAPSTYQVSCFALLQPSPGNTGPEPQKSLMGTIVSVSTPGQLTRVPVSRPILPAPPTGNQISAVPSPVAAPCQTQEEEQHQRLKEVNGSSASPSASPSCEQSLGPGIEPRSSSPKQQQQNPVVRAVADSACDGGVQQFAPRRQEPAENEPTSTVSEELAPAGEPSATDSSEEREASDRDAEISDRDAKERVASDSDAEISDRDAEISDRDAKISDRDAEISDRDAKEREASDRDAEISDRDAKISDRDAKEREASDRDAEISETDADASETDALGSDAELLDRDGELLDQDAELLDRDAEISDRDAEELQLSLEVTESDASETDAEISDRDAEASDRDAEASDRDAEASDRDAEISDRDAVASDSDAEISDRDAVASDSDAVASDRDAVASGSDAEASDRDTEISDRDAEISDRDAEELELSLEVTESEAEEPEADASETDAVASDRDAVASDRDAVASDRDAVASDRDAVASDRDAVASDRDAVASDRDAVASDRDTELLDSDAVASDRDAVASDRDAVASDRDAVASDRDAVASDRDAEPGVPECSLSHWQPRVSLFRLPVPSQRLEHPLPSFRLLAGDADDDIYLEEIGQDTQYLSDDATDDIDTPSPPGSPLAVQMVACSACRLANASIICMSCGRGFHQDCHIPPVRPDIMADWMCSLCQDLSDPSDPFLSHRPQRPASLSLSLLNQRRCEKLLLLLKVKASSGLCETHLDWMKERLIRGSPAYRTAADFLSDVRRLFKDASPDDFFLNKLQKRMRRLSAAFMAEENANASRALGSNVAAAAPSGSKVTAREEQEVMSYEARLKETRKRLREALMDTSLSKRRKTEPSPKDSGN